MQISRLFEFSPFLALSFCVCLGTVLWCILLLRRGCHHVADRFLVGFIGLLSVYQTVQILRRGGVLAIPSFRHVDEALNLLVNSLYLLAALLLRISNRDRVESLFRLRLAEAEPISYLRDGPLEPHIGDPKLAEKLRRAVPVLSPHALKVYLYICLHADRQTGLLEAKEEELTELLGNDRRALLNAFKELKERSLCEIEQEQLNKPVRIKSTTASSKMGGEPASA